MYSYAGEREMLYLQGSPVGGSEFLFLHRDLLGYLRHQYLTLNHEKTYKKISSVFGGNLPEHNLSPTRGRQFEDHVGLPEKLKCLPWVWFFFRP